MSDPRRILIGTLLAFLAQSLLLGGMIARQAYALRSGMTLTLSATPAYPRDPLLGDYLTMEFPISRAAWSASDGERAGVGRVIYAQIEKDKEGAWRVSSLHRDMPAASETRPVLRGRAREWTGDNLILEYGIERYYLPEGDAQEILKALEDGALRLEIALSSGTGQASIRRLLVNGEPRYEDPLFIGE